MASQQPASSKFPPSMGPGARQVEGDSPGSVGIESLSEFTQHRREYSIEREAMGMKLGYELNGRQPTHFIQFENMPIGSLRQWILFGGESRARITSMFVIDMLRGLETKIDKPLTQPQVDGIALHSSKRMLYTYSATWGAFVGGTALAWHGRKDMKFPFMKAKPAERYTNFPNRYIPVIQGQVARSLWQLTRGCVWVAVGLFTLNPILGSVGGTSMITGLYRDERTKALMMDVKGKLGRHTMNQPNPASRGASTPPQQANRSEDSFSTSGTGNDSNAFDQSSGYSSTYEDQTGPPSTFTSATENQPQGSQSKWTGRTTSENLNLQSQRTDSSSSSDFFDDASPTAGNDPDPSTPATYQSSGSAWDRVRGGTRRQASETPVQQRRQSSRAKPTDPGESFSFSGSDQERLYAKEQAQKQFDAMLERERKDSGSKEYESGMDAAQQGQERAGGDGGSAWDRRRS